MSRWLAGGLGGVTPEKQITKQPVPESEKTTKFKCNLCEEKHPQGTMSLTGVDEDEKDIHTCHYCLGKRARPVEADSSKSEEKVEHVCKRDPAGMFCTEPSCGRLMI